MNEISILAEKAPENTSALLWLKYKEAMAAPKQDLVRARATFLSFLEEAGVLGLGLFLHFCVQHSIFSSLYSHCGGTITPPYLPHLGHSYSYTDLTDIP